MRDSEESDAWPSNMPSEDALAWGLERFRGRIAVVSSFGAESAVLLRRVSVLDPHVPVLFLDTGQHFEETLDYRDRLAADLGLTDVRNVRPETARLREDDPDGELWQFDPDACCDLRKVSPLDRALAPFEAWITGRKRHQTGTRRTMRVVEKVGPRFRINPLADWSAGRVAQEMRRFSLPAHPLVSFGYASIGCATCTRAIAAGEDPRAGRWSGLAKIECGIHRPAA